MWPIITTCKFLRRPPGHRLLAVRLQLKVDMIVDLKFNISAFEVSILFHLISSMRQMRFQLLQDLISSFQGPINFMNRRVSPVIPRHHRWMSTIQSQERRHTNCSMEGRVIPKFCPRQKRAPLARLLRCEAAKVLLQTTIVTSDWPSVSG